MNKYEYPSDAPAQRSTARLGLWDLLSSLAVLMTACVSGYYLLIFINPNTPLDPIRRRRRSVRRRLSP
jgi:hypothetical protein